MCRIVMGVAGVCLDHVSYTFITAIYLPSIVLLLFFLLQMSTAVKKQLFADMRC